MSFWKRLFICISSYASSFLSRFENPVLKTERAIKLLKNLYQESFDNLAQVKALIITATNDIYDKKNRIAQCKSKVSDLMKSVKDGSISERKADSLASQVIASQLRLEKEVEHQEESLRKYKKLEENLETKAAKIKQDIGDYELELSSLKARMNVASVLKELSKSSCNASDESVSSLIEETKSKVNQEEALAEAYEALNEPSLDEQIDAALGRTADAKVIEELKKAKEKAGLN